MVSILAFIFSIGLLVLVHELGHYLAAKSVGVKVEKFYIGFNPGFSFFKKVINGTEYGIGWLPLGGYVKLAGMLDESLDVKRTNESTDFHCQPMWAKIWVMSAGVLMNFLLATLIFSIMSFKHGISEPASDEPTIANIITDHYDSRGEVVKKSAAYELGLQAGDKIIEIDGLDINTWDDLSSSIRNKPNQLIYIKWTRNNQIKEGSIKTDTTIAVIDYKLNTVGVLGITREVNNIELGVIGSLYNGFQMMKEFLIRMIFSLYALIKGDVSLKELSGPVGIAKIAGDSAKAGVESLFYLIAILSINLGLINILPIPGLDGGHVFITLIEGLLGRELSINVKMGIQQAGILLLLSLFIFIMVNDISKLL